MKFAAIIREMMDSTWLTSKKYWSWWRDESAICRRCQYTFNVPFSTYDANLELSPVNNSFSFKRSELKSDSKPKPANRR